MVAQILDGKATLATVKAEREKMRLTGSSELMELLIAYEWKDMFGGFDQDPAAASVVRWVE